MSCYRQAMTTIFNIKKTCAICNTTNDYTGIGSTNRFGAPDLDTRPPEMMRSTIRYWVQRCPKCGHCSPDVAESQKNIASETIQSADYQAQLNHADFPTLANTFLCWALLQEAAGDLLGAGWSTIHAAWICDDENEKAAAKICRQKTINRFQAASDQNILISQQAGMEFALLADLHRRNGNFEVIAALVEQGLKSQPDDIVTKILEFQQVLAENRDSGCYTVAHAEKYGKD